MIPVQATSCWRLPTSVNWLAPLRPAGDCALILTTLLNKSVTNAPDFSVSFMDVFKDFLEVIFFIDHIISENWNKYQGVRL